MLLLAKIQNLYNFSVGSFGVIMITSEALVVDCVVLIGKQD